MTTSVRILYFDQHYFTIIGSFILIDTLYLKMNENFHAFSLKKDTCYTLKIWKEYKKI